jgi:TRAP-type C4-dicarboxylate transport system permease small subunit
MKAISWVSKAAEKTATFLGALILAVMLAFMTAGVVFRYLLNSPLAWTDETAMILIVWMVFFGASIGVRERTHVGTAAFLSLFPSRFRKIIVISTDLLIAFFSAYLMVFGWKISLVGTGQQTVYWGVSYFYLYLSISAGGLLLLIQSISIIIDDLQQFGGWKNPD